MMRRWLLLVLVLFASHAKADAGEQRWTLVLSDFVAHYTNDPDHNNNPQFIGLQYQLEDSRWHVGGSTFYNSFGQRSVYAWMGTRFDATHNPLYLKVTGGFLHGYRGEFRDKIPYNSRGIAPAIVPAIGVQEGRMAAEIIILGNSALMLAFAMDF